MGQPKTPFQWVSITPVGSRETCNPPPIGTDRDWLALIASSEWSALDSALKQDGWELGGSFSAHESVPIPEDDRFCSYTKLIDDVLENIIVTDSIVFHKRFLAATGVAKRLNLLEKSARVDLFQAVLYGNDTGAKA
jgi:hypothetical protein